MKIYCPTDAEYDEMKAKMNRRALPETSVNATVAEIIHHVAQHGDQALFDYAKRFDKVDLTKDTLKVTEDELLEAEASVSDSLKEAVRVSLANIDYFTQMSKRCDWHGVNHQGVSVAERFVPFDCVGGYIPGGKAPLVSTPRSVERRAGNER